MYQKLTKCNFCKYFVGRQCSAAKPNGQVNEYYCRDAKNEFFAYLDKLKKKKN